MDLTKLPKTAAYKPQTPETLQAMCERFGVDKRKLPKLNPKWEWDEYRKWSFHFTNITKYAACPICNGPQRYERGGLVCMDYPSHATAWRFAVRSLHRDVKRGIIQLSDGKMLEIPEVNDFLSTAVQRFLGYVCSHDHFVMDCPERIAHLYPREETECPKNESMNNSTPIAVPAVTAAV